MNWTKVSLIAGSIAAVGASLSVSWYAWAWGVNYVVADRIQAVKTEVMLVGGRVDLNTYDTLLRRLKAEGRLSPRDLRAFCQAAARLQIKHRLCR